MSSFDITKRPDVFQNYFSLTLANFLILEGILATQNCPVLLWWHHPALGAANPMICFSIGLAGWLQAEPQGHLNRKPGLIVAFLATLAATSQSQCRFRLAHPLEDSGCPEP